MGPHETIVRDASRTIASRVDLARQRVVADSGEAFEISGIGPGTYRVTDGTDVWRVYVAGSADDLWVFLDGDVFEVEVTSGRERQAVRPPARSAADGALSAPMPATVIKILVEAGQAVQPGDTLIVLEAMKMELPVRAPRGGTIRAIHCAEGELVQPGVPLLELA